MKILSILKDIFHALESLSVILVSAQVHTTFGASDCRPELTPKNKLFYSFNHLNISRQLSFVNGGSLKMFNPMLTLTFSLVPVFRFTYLKRGHGHDA